MPIHDMQVRTNEGIEGSWMSVISTFTAGSYSLCVQSPSVADHCCQRFESSYGVGGDRLMVNDPGVASERSW